MYPAVGTATTRINYEQDIALDGGRLVIPRGVPIRMHIHSIQNCAANWERAAEFLPERFLQPDAEFMPAAAKPAAGAAQGRARPGCAPGWAAHANAKSHCINESSSICSSMPCLTSYVLSAVCAVQGMAWAAPPSSSRARRAAAHLRPRAATAPRWWSASAAGASSPSATGYAPSFHPEQHESPTAVRIACGRKPS